MNEAGTLKVFIHSVPFGYPRRRSSSVRRLGLFRSFGPIRPDKSAFMCPAIQIRLLRNQNELRAKPLRLVDRHDILDAIRFGFAAACDHGHSVRSLEGNDTDRPTAQASVALLFDRREKAVEIQIEPFDGFRLCAWLLLLHEQKQNARRWVPRQEEFFLMRNLSGALLQHP